MTRLISPKEQEKAPKPRQHRWPFLVSGVRSGFGRYLHERFGGAGLTRLTPPAECQLLREEGADTIIHCAADSRRGLELGQLFQHIDDNLFLTQRLVSMPHHRFVYISSVDVYPKTPGPHRETDPLQIDSARGVYAMTKLMSEAVVLRAAQHPLILRPTALLGANSRRNSLIRLIEDDPRPLSLSGDSAINYVLHEDVADFIAMALETGLEGTYNAASTGTVTLAEVAERHGKRTAFGRYLYDVGSIDNARIAALWPAFARSSREAVELFLRQRALAAG